MIDRRQSRILPVLAAVILLSVAGACRESPSSSVAEPEATTPLQPVAPSGDVRGPLTFSWQGTSADRVVRVFIVDAAERAVTDFEARGRSAVAPAIVLDAIQPGAAMGWRVAALDENGQPARLSALTRFVWQPR